MAGEIESQSSDVEQALLHVDRNNRVELDRFERLGSGGARLRSLAFERHSLRFE
jgi:hypothetical protein